MYVIPADAATWADVMPDSLKADTAFVPSSLMSNLAHSFSCLWIDKSSEVKPARMRNESECYTQI